MSEKERKKFKISKRILSSFKRSKKLVKINEEPSILDESKFSECETSYFHDNETDTAFGEVTDVGTTVDFDPHGKASGARPKVRTSSSSLEGVEGHIVARPQASPNFRDFDLHSSFSVSTDSGIDCTNLNPDRGLSPEKFQAFTRREAERLRKENQHLLESNSEKTLDINSEERDTGKVSAENNDLFSEIKTVLVDKLNDEEPDLEKQLELAETSVNEDSVAVSGHLSESVCSIKKCVVDEENQNIQCSAAVCNSVIPSCASGSCPQTSLPNSVEQCFLDMYANKTDEIKSKEARQERRNRESRHTSDSLILDSSHMIVSPTPQKPVTSQAEHKTLPSTPSPVRMYVNEKSAFARYRSLRRSVSDVGKGILGKFRHKKRHNSSSQDDDHVDKKSEHKSRRKKHSSKSHDSKSLAVSNSDDHNATLNDSILSINASSLESLNDKDTGKRRARYFHARYNLNTSSLDDFSVSSVQKESKTYEVCGGTMSPAATETIQDLTLSICEMTSSLIGERCNSEGSIKCICDCKDRDTNSLCCEKRRSQDLDDILTVDVPTGNKEVENSEFEVHVDEVCDLKATAQAGSLDQDTDTSSSSLDSADFYTDDTASETESEYTDFDTSVVDDVFVSDNVSHCSSKDNQNGSLNQDSSICQNDFEKEHWKSKLGAGPTSFSVSFENLIDPTIFNEHLSEHSFQGKQNYSSQQVCDKSYHGSPTQNAATPACSPNVDYETHRQHNQRSHQSHHRQNTKHREAKHQPQNSSFLENDSYYPTYNNRNRMPHLEPYFDFQHRHPGDGSPGLNNSHATRSCSHLDSASNLSQHSSFQRKDRNRSSSSLNRSINSAHSGNYYKSDLNRSIGALNYSLNSSHNNSYHDDLNQSYTPPLDLSMRKESTQENRSAFWIDRHVGQVYSPAKRVLHKNSGLSETDLCRRILNLYVDEPEPAFPGGECDKSFEEAASFVEPDRHTVISANDSMLQYGTYVAPRVVKETNVDDFSTTSRPACYPGEARLRRLHASPTSSTLMIRGEDRRLAAQEELKKARRETRPRSSSAGRETRRESRDRHSRAESRERRRQDSSVLKDRTNTQVRERSLEGRSRRQAKEEKESHRKHQKEIAKSSHQENPDGRTSGQTRRQTDKENLDTAQFCEKTFDRLTYIHTYRNSERKVRCLSLNEAQSVVKHYPPPKEASKVSWNETLCKLDGSLHTPRKTPVKTKPILAKKPDMKYPYDEETPSPIVLTKMRKSKSLSRKYKNWPW